MLSGTERGREKREKKIPTVWKTKCVAMVLSHLTSITLMKAIQEDSTGEKKPLHALYFEGNKKTVLGKRNEKG